MLRELLWLSMKRVKLCKIFKEIYPEDVKINIYCNKKDFDVDGWWKDRNKAREVVYEYFAFIWHALFGS